VARRERGPEQLETLASCLNIGVKMFVHGIPVSKSGVEGWRAPLKEKAVAAKAALIERVEKAMLWDVGLGEFNPNKPAHIRWLFSQLGVPSPKKTAKGLDSFDAEALVKLKEHPAPTVAELAAAILAEREPKKLLSTYIDGLPVHPDGRVHPRWAPLATLTGRWSSRQPNAQNIPDYMYGIFEVAPGLWWVKVDQSQLELRIAAFFSGEERLIQAYLDGADVHSMNARVFFGLPPGAKVTKPMRQFAKGGAYGLGYGAADKTVLARMKENEAIPREMRDRIGLPEMAQARYNYFKAYPGIKRRQEETLRFAMENRYIEEEISGRRVYFPGEVDVSVVYNFPIQTFAGKVMNDGIIELDAALDWEREAILDQVHDSVTVCGPDPGRLFQLLKRCFEREYTYRGRTMRFRIEGKYGQGQLSGGTPFDADATVLPSPP
jgi:DNA polymerase-1